MSQTQSYPVDTRRRFNVYKTSIRLRLGKSHIYCVNQFLREKRHKKLNQECKQKQSLLFNVCNIFDLLTSRTRKMARLPPAFKPDFYIFSFNEQLRKI